IAGLLQAEVAAGLDDGGPNLWAFFRRAPELQAGLAGHAVLQGPNASAGDRYLAHVEELDRGKRSAVQLLQDLQRVRPLNLVAVCPPRHRIRDFAFITLYLDVITTRPCVKLHPVHDRRPADDADLVLLQVEH